MLLVAGLGLSSGGIQPTMSADQSGDTGTIGARADIIDDIIDIIGGLVGGGGNGSGSKP